MKVLIIKNKQLLFLTDVETAFASLGVETRALFMEEPEFLTHLVESVVYFQPDFVFSIPISLQLSGLSAVLKRPIVHWELDKIMNQQWLTNASYGPYDIIFSTYKQDVAHFSSLGIPAFYLPFACNIRHHGKPDTTLPTWDVSFVGSVERKQLTLYQNCLANHPHPDALETLFESLLTRLMRPQEAHLDFRHLVNAVAHPLAELNQNALIQLEPFFVASMLAKEGCRRKREAYLRAWPEVAIFGPPDWQLVPWENLRYQGAVPQYEQSSQIFFASRINLSITRPHAMDGMTDRIFNVLYSQGFLLTDRVDPLLEQFTDGVDLETYGCVEEMTDKIRFFLTHETPRQTIARQGERTVLARHTFVHRLQEMLSLLQHLL